MKKVVTLLCILFLLGLGAQSTFAQILTEDFNYTSGTALVGQGGWLQTGTVTTNPLTVTVADSNLSLAGMTTYPSGGNAIWMKNTGQDANNKFTADSIDANVGSGVVYASFLIRVDSACRGQKLDGDYFFLFGDHGWGTEWTPGMNTGEFWARIYVKKGAQLDSALTFGVAKGSLPTGTHPMFTDTIYQQGVTYLMVVKYDFATGDTASANASLYVFKAGDDWTAEPGSPNAGPSYTSSPQFPANISGAPEISFVGLRQGTVNTAPFVVIDGIHVSTTWQSLNLPVELTSFNAVSAGKSVELAWSTATEVNNSGFAVERKTATSAYAQVAFVAGNGTSNVGHHYSYTDAVSAGTYTYRLKQIDHDGKFEYSKAVEATVGLTPGDYALSQNYPNPFNPTTVITFAVKTDQKASMKVYNMLGQEVMTLFDGVAKADQLNHVQFNASSLSSGTYFYILQTNDTRQVKKMVLLK
jgi:hypothetical protein